MTREEAKLAAVKLMDEAIRPDGITDEEWSLFTKYVYEYDEDKLADDLLIGIANGHSIEKQTELAKIACKPYKEQLSEYWYAISDQLKK